jgi:hypothetical protein
MSGPDQKSAWPNQFAFTHSAEPEMKAIGVSRFISPTHAAIVADLLEQAVSIQPEPDFPIAQPHVINLYNLGNDDGSLFRQDILAAVIFARLQKIFGQNSDLYLNLFDQNQDAINLLTGNQFIYSFPYTDSRLADWKSFLDDSGQKDKIVQMSDIPTSHHSQFFDRELFSRYPHTQIREAKIPVLLQTFLKNSKLQKFNGDIETNSANISQHANIAVITNAMRRRPMLPYAAGKPDQLSIAFTHLVSAIRPRGLIIISDSYNLNDHPETYLQPLTPEALKVNMVTDITRKFMVNRAEINKIQYRVYQKSA